MSGRDSESTFKSSKEQFNCDTHGPGACVCLGSRYWMDRALAAERRAAETTDNEPNGEIGDAIACITYALERSADLHEWARLLRDSRAVIERLDSALTEAKRQRNDEQRLRLAAERGQLKASEAPLRQCACTPDYCAGEEWARCNRYLCRRAEKPEVHHPLNDRRGVRHSSQCARWQDTSSGEQPKCDCGAQKTSEDYRREHHELSKKLDEQR